jgi:CubicO group peptidase (beta-lactamase class C family)
MLLMATGCGRQASRAASKTSTWQTFQEYLKQRTAADEFSGAVCMADDGQAFGMADKNHPNTPRTKFCICSMGKMFTAVAIAQLVERHKLNFTDTIGKHTAGFPAKVADTVTVHELLTHTAGMGDALSGPTPPTTLAGLMKMIIRTPLLFEPGARFSYSNSGFIVLGAIIEHLTGQKYADYIRRHIFGPAGMTDTEIRVYKPDQVPGMAHGYALTQPPGPGPAPTGPVVDIGDHLQIGNPSGGAYSTVTDMVRFARALMAGRLLSPELTATVTTGKVKVSRPGGPAQDSYAYGFEDQRINGVRIIGHNGGSPGYEGQLDIYPDTGRVVVILTNKDGSLVPAIQRSEQLLTA